VELKWYCAFCEQHLTVEHSGPRLPFMKPPRQIAAQRLLARVDDHIDFHAWQFGNEIKYQWLEDQEMDDD